MRPTMMFAAAAAVVAMSAGSASAEEWCGSGVHTHSLIECGYSSNVECENALGNGGTCFVDPDYALNVRRFLPRRPSPATARS